MNKPLAYLMAFLLVLGSLFYVYGIFVACRISWTGHGLENPRNAYLWNVVTSIAAVLATNLGAVLGIAIATPGSKFAQLKTWNPVSFFENEFPTPIQVAACYVYILSLIATAIVWAHTGFEEDAKKIIPLIPTMAKTLVGVIVGVISVSLNIPKKTV